ncbi:MAG: hypothetical protein IT385_23175 [Deltaproteobacteria bacterium]|nr:hypothetical protein [Deltaproteobacteria bacterium]
MRTIILGSIVGVGLGVGGLTAVQAEGPDTQAVVCEVVGLDLTLGLDGELRLDHDAPRRMTIIQGGELRLAGYATPRWTPGDGGAGVASFKGQQIEVVLRPTAPEVTPGARIGAAVVYEEFGYPKQFRGYCQFGTPLVHR